MELPSSKSGKAQNLLGQLRTIVEEQEKTIAQQQLQISSLKLELESITKSRDALLEKNKKLENELEIGNAVKRHSRKDSSGKHSRTQSGHLIENHSVSVDRSGSFHFEDQDVRHHKTDDYELSSDIRDKQLNALRNQYGGADKCERAARIIQQAYRKYQMKVKFETIRKSRKRRLTMEIDLSSAQDLNSLPNDNVEIKTFASINGTSADDRLNHPSAESGQDLPVDLNHSETAERVTPNNHAPVEAWTDCEHSERTVIEKQNKVTFQSVNDSDHVDDKSLLFSLADSANISQQRISRRRKRHGYETVVLTGQLPATPEHREFPTEPKIAITVGNCAQVKRNSDADAHGRRLSSGWTRVNSDASLASFDNDPDRESLRSSDTGSINSEMLSNSGEGTASNYSARTSVRGSWNFEMTHDQEQKRRYRIGLNLFNMKPSKGLNFLIEHQFVENTPSAVATFLYNRNGLSRQMVGEYLGNPQKAFNQKVLDCVCDLMDFRDIELDEALRLFQGDIRVQGEAQKVERLVEAFSQRYCTCNPKLAQTLQSPDSIFILAFAIIMLNTDLHSPNMKHEKRMTEQDFIKNLRGVDNGEDMSELLLKNIYNRIKARELVTKDDHVTHVVKVENSIVGKKPVLSVPQRRLISRCRLFQVHDVTKPQKVGLHQREVFLFNDLILITKTLQRKKQGTTYTFKQSISLHGLTCFLFDSIYYPHGIRLHSPTANKVIMTFNAPNDQDKTRFYNDVKECIAEVQLMETLRIGAELERVQLHAPTDGRSNKLFNANSKRFSTSMQNLSDPRFVPVDIGFNRRSTSNYSLSSVNENNNHVTPSTNDEARKPVVSPSSRNPSRLSGFGTFFTTPSRRSDSKRPARASESLIPYSTPNGDTPGVTLTFHKVHEV